MKSSSAIYSLAAKFEGMKKRGKERRFHTFIGCIFRSNTGIE
jgi:hypothetical protein